MTGKRTPVPASGEPTAPRQRRGGARPDPAALCEGLDRLRDALLQRLDRIEALAAEQAALLDRDPSERERALRERVALLEASQARLQAEVKRREQEWQAVLQEVEDDRRLLAEAWERVERERVEAPHGDSAIAPPRAAAPTAHAAVAAPAAAVAAHRPPPGDPASDSVTRAILWQFQALKNDVRRNAKGQNGR
jgi:hypothetical protein